MRLFLNVFAVVAVTCAVAVATDAWINNARRRPCTVELVSGGQVVRAWKTPRLPESYWDWYVFEDAETGQRVRVRGDLIVTPE